MLASPGPLPTEAGWAYEVKWDGMRVLGSVDDRRLRLTSRTGADASDRFPEVAGSALAALPRGTVVDGELVVLDHHSRPSFAMLAPRIQARAGARPGAPPATYLVFDLLRLGSKDLLQSSYVERRRALLDLVRPSASVLVPDSFDDGPALLRSTAEQGLEGVVAKRLTSTYQPGVRSRDWIKVPHRTTQSYVVGGWRTRAGSPGRLASLLVGTPVSRGVLAFDGSVGSGLGVRDSSALLEVLAETEVAEPPFAERPPQGERTDVVRWVEPLLVVDVEHLGRSAQGLLRQPTVRRLRPDLSPDDLVAEVPS